MSRTEIELDALPFLDRGRVVQLFDLASTAGSKDRMDGAVMRGHVPAPMALCRYFDLFAGTEEDIDALAVLHATGAVIPSPDGVMAELVARSPARGGQPLTLIRAIRRGELPENGIVLGPREVDAAPHQRIELQGLARFDLVDHVPILPIDPEDDHAARGGPCTLLVLDAPAALEDDLAAMTWRSGGVEVPVVAGPPRRLVAAGKEALGVIVYALPALGVGLALSVAHVDVRVFYAALTAYSLGAALQSFAKGMFGARRS